MNRLYYWWLMGWCPAALKHKALMVWWAIRPQWAARMAEDKCIRELRQRKAAHQ